MHIRNQGSRARVVVSGGVLAGAAVVVLSLLAGGQPYRAVGSADPGVLVEVATPVLRLLADLSATVCLGALAFVVCCTRPQSSGLVSAGGYGELRVAYRSALVWAVSALLLVPFSAADTAGLPLGTVLTPANLTGLLGAMEQPRAWAVTTVVSAGIAAGSRAALRWQPAALMLGLAVFALLPPLVTGHGSADLGHDVTLAAILVHVPVACLWLGSLLAFLRHQRDGPVLAARYARLATSCWLALLASGLVLALVLVPPGGLFSGYGVLLIVKTVLALALGGAGTVLRRRARASRPRVLLADLLPLLGVLAVSVELAHLSVPGALDRATTTAQTLLGYNLAGPPTLLRLAADWRIDVLFGPLAVALAAGYLLGVRRVERWPAARTTAWLGGCAVLLLATCSGIGRYAAAMFSVHIAAHMLVSMLVPALLVLGAPLTLARALRGERGPLPRPSEWLLMVAGSRAVRLLTHPIVALLLFAGSPFALYFTGLYDVAVRFHWAHLAIDAWFLGTGYLFLWPVIGVDATARPTPNLARLGMLLAAMPADIVFGAALMGTHRVIGNGVASANMYQALALPWVPDLAADQRLAGLLALILGELALFVVLAALLARWNTVDDIDEPSRALLETRHAN